MGVLAINVDGWDALTNRSGQVGDLGESGSSSIAKWIDDSGECLIDLFILQDLSGPRSVGRHRHENSLGRSWRPHLWQPPFHTTQVPNAFSCKALHTWSKLSGNRSTSTLCSLPGHGAHYIKNRGIKVDQVNYKSVCCYVLFRLLRMTRPGKSVFPPLKEFLDKVSNREY